MDSDWIGKTLSGRYRIDQFLGRGGMAEVYKVWDTQRSTNLAMKLLLEDLAVDRVFLRRFKREAETLARLQHPNIVRFYGMEQDGPYAFMLMDFIEGKTLKRVIFDHGRPFSSRQTIDYLRPICGALQYAHNQGLIHCDLKPANVMINKHGDVLLSDFGIARMTDSATATMVGMGTPAYMAPEQVKGLDPVPQTDIYALGIILFEMLTGGERPFTGERATITGTTSAKVRWEQINLNPPSLQKLNSNLSPAVEALIVQCLEKEPSNRPTNILTVLSGIESIVYGEKEQNTQDHLNDIPVIGYTRPPKPTKEDGDPIVRKQKKYQVFSIAFPIAAGVLLLSLFLLGGLLVNKFILPGLNKSKKTEQSIITLTLADSEGSNAETMPPTIMPGAVATSTITPIINLPQIQINSGNINNLVLKEQIQLNLPITSMDWSPDGDQLVIGTGDHGVNELNHPEEGGIWTWTPRQPDSLELIMKDVARITSVDWSPVGNLIASGSGDKFIRLWDPTTGNQIYSMKESLGEINRVNFSFDGSYLLSNLILGSIYGDQAAGYITIWDSATGEQIKRISTQEWLQDSAWSPNDLLLANIEKGPRLVLWDFKKLTQEWSYTRNNFEFSEFAWSPDGKLIAVLAHAWGDAYYIILLNAERKEYDAIVEFSPNDEISSIDLALPTWSPNNEILAVHEAKVGGRDVDGKFELTFLESLTFVDVNSNEVIARVELSKQVFWDDGQEEEIQLAPFVSSITWSPKGDSIAIGSPSGQVSVWGIEE